MHDYNIDSYEIFKTISTKEGSKKLLYALLLSGLKIYIYI